MEEFSLDAIIHHHYTHLPGGKLSGETEASKDETYCNLWAGFTRNP